MFITGNFDATNMPMVMSDCSGLRDSAWWETFKEFTWRDWTLSLALALGLALFLLIVVTR